MSVQAASKDKPSTKSKSLPPSWLPQRESSAAVLAGLTLAAVWFLSMMLANLFGPARAAIAFGLVAAVVFYPLMEYYLPRTRVFWKSTDYFTLVVGGIGLVGLNDKAQEGWFHESLTLTQALADGRVGHAKSEVTRERTSLLRQLSTQAQTPGPQQDDAGDRQTRVNREKMELEATIAWADEVLLHLLNKPERVSWRNHLPPPPPVDKPAQMLERKRILAALDELFTADDEHRRFEAKTKKTPLEYNWHAFAPWLTALAAAVRLTKTTAEVKGYDRGEEAGQGASLPPSLPASEPSADNPQPPQATQPR